MDESQPLKIAILGGSGFLGRHLTDYLLKNTDWSIVSVSHKPLLTTVPTEFGGRLEYLTADVLNEHELTSTLKNIDVAYYFVHMMGQKTGNFYELETQAAETMKRVSNKLNLKRIVYMGGLGSDSDKLSEHLTSRHRTGKILRSSNATVIEFQASMVVGRGSVAFDIIAALVDRLPIMPLPASASTLTQPILLSDALQYLKSAATVRTISGIVQIGGAKVMSYEEIYKMYAEFVSKKRYIVRVPVIPARLEAVFLDWFTPSVHAKIGQAMVESLDNEMIVTSNNAQKIFPHIHPSSVEAGLEKLAQ